MKRNNRPLCKLSCSRPFCYIWIFLEIGLSLFKISFTENLKHLCSQEPLQERLLHWWNFATFQDYTRYQVYAIFSNKLFFSNHFIIYLQSTTHSKHFFIENSAWQLLSWSRKTTEWHCMSTVDQKFVNLSQ